MFGRLLAVMALFSCAVCAQEEGKFEPFTGEVQGSRVRVRLQPDLEGHIVREVNQGELLVVVGEAHDYYAVQPSEDAKAFVYRTYILDGEVTGSHVNVRLSPDVESPIIGQLNAGDKVEGKIAEGNSRWLEIAPPSGACFFVAKEYLQNIGDAQLIATRARREGEVRHLLNSAYLTSQAELRKPFQEIDMARLEGGFQRVIEEYSEFPQFCEKAEKISGMAKEIYLQKKVAYLESKSVDPAMPWDESTEIFTDALEEYHKQLKGFEKELLDEGLAVAESKEVEVITLELSPDEVINADITADFGEAISLVDEKANGRMEQWEPVEEALYHLWAMDNGDCTIREFYEEQEYQAEYVEGIVEAYTRPVQNRPGDYMLRQDGRPVAFLYSTRIDLEELVGKKVMVKVLERPNHHFAFPAYFVASVE